MKEELEKATNELEDAIKNPNVDSEKVFEISKNIDKLIELNYLCKQNNEDTQNKMKNS